jgi:hypothetical protein
MKEVTGSKQYRSIVVQDRPSRRRLMILSVIALLVVVAQLAYWYGGQSISADYQKLSQDHNEVVEQLSLSKARYDDASQQLTNLQLGSDIDRMAVNDVRSTVSEHKQTINQLNEEINFYKGLMAPTERERGLGIRSWEVYPGSAANRFQFKLVLQQLALKHTVLKGTVQVDIVGKRGGVEEVLSLDILSEQIDSQGLKLRFKYFQYIDGELVIPEGFVPERIDIVAKATSPKAVKVEKYYSWLVQQTDI